MTSARALQAFVVAALAVALTAGFGLGLWLLLARTLGLSTFGIAWLVIAQVHGTVQLFGFAALFLMGIGLSVLPRFRGAPPAPHALVALAFAGTIVAVVARAVVQPLATLPARDAVLAFSGALLVVGTLAFAFAGLRALRAGTNAHRPDEMVMGAGVAAAPIGALFVAIEMPFVGAPLLVDQAADDRAVWVMLLGCLATAIFGVWARLAPGFVATPPARPRRLLLGVALWDAGVAAIVLGLPLAGVALLAGVLVVTSALGVYGATIARQPLKGYARLTRFAVRSAFGWAIVGAALLAWLGFRGSPSYLETSAARHAFALGFVTLMIYAVAARALPTLLDRRPWSARLQLVAVGCADLGVALRVIPQALTTDALALEALSGVLSYLGLVAFALGVARALANAALRSAPPPGTAGVTRACGAEDQGCSAHS